MTSTAIIPLQSAVVLRGQHAWSRIKSTAAEQRELWRQVGEALLVGRREHPSNQAFGRWCAEQGFDMDARVRSDAMWLVSSGPQKTPPDGISSPTEIRRWFNERQADTPPAPSLHIETPSRLTAGIEVVAPIAKKVNKLAAMAERGEGQEQETAKKYLAVASKGNMRGAQGTLRARMPMFGAKLRAGI